jgi:hypothetical protein
LHDAEYRLGQFPEGDEHVSHGVVFADADEHVGFTGLLNCLDLIEGHMKVDDYFGAIWHTAPPYPPDIGGGIDRHIDHAPWVAFFSVPLASVCQISLEKLRPGERLRRIEEAKPRLAVEGQHASAAAIAAVTAAGSLMTLRSTMKSRRRAAMSSHERQRIQ